ncbi:Starch-binding associating with outer membrane [Pricia antarctica]|uniref:Starch-binding associating with outer membrane n=1 Tax=Pricia antarctica TaxID=641691 RepID=A0A1G7J3K2_9FLAO|nr:RagB/SusD family nutrient uptake outer membrane protein [Pricia antarctica]SDF19099.1 Starch-binding associating with outer membrane [Pricia antarctica]
MKLNRFILIIIFLISIVSCDDFLDTPSKSQISLSGFWQTRSDAELGVAAIYDAMQKALETNFWNWGELRGDNFILNDRPDASAEAVISNNLTIGTDGSDWTTLYAAIANANIAIEKIPEISAFASQDGLLAQALTMRAMLYFYAVRVWGDVPKITESIKEASGDINKPRSPKMEIYNDIILPDLVRAESLIQTDANMNFISRGSLLALKAHVYAWPGQHRNYQITLDAINELETLGYALETTPEGWINIFQGNESSSEIIFWLKWNFAEDGNNGGVGAFSSGTPNLVPAETLETKWESSIPGDYRIPETAAFDIEITNPDEFPFLRTLTKYLGVFTDRRDQQDASAVNDVDVPMFRLSELLLLKAEAQNYLGNGSAALGILNEIRTARTLPILVDGTDVDSGNQIEMRDLILDERQFELVGEGQRFWDLVRNGVAVEVMSQVTDIKGNSNGLDNENEILWPISQNVLNRNPNIEQNEAYK